MWEKVRYFLAVVPPIIAIVIGSIGYQLDKKGYELEAKKLREGQIPKKTLLIETYGGTDIMKLLKKFTDETFSINMAGKELKKKGSSLRLTFIKEYHYCPVNFFKNHIIY